MIKFRCFYVLNYMVSTEFNKIIEIVQVILGYIREVVSMMKNKFMKYFKSQSKNKIIIMSIGFVLLITLIIYIPFS